MTKTDLTRSLARKSVAIQGVQAVNEIVRSNQLTEADDLPAPTCDEVKAALDVVRRYRASGLDSNLLAETMRGRNEDFNRSYPEQFTSG